jgi:hypothetical protein
MSYNTMYPSKVLVFSEKVKGWVSFRSHIDMQNGISMGNDYYTFFTGTSGNLWIHYDESISRNTFYNGYAESTVSVVLNASPESVKVFNTLNYEGSQSKIDKFVSQNVTLPFQNTTTYNDQEIYNLSGKNGWYVNGVFTDMEQGFICEFIGKENKWFNNVSRFINTNLRSADTSDFTFQGIGNVTSVINDNTTMAATAVNAEGIVIFDCTIITDPIDPIDPIGPKPVYGCTNPLATNYNPLATIDNGSCLIRVIGDPIGPRDPIDPRDPRVVYGCTNPLATNYNPLATIDDGSCLIKVDVKP